MVLGTCVEGVVKLEVLTPPEIGDIFAIATLMSMKAFMVIIPESDACATLECLYEPHNILAIISHTLILTRHLNQIIEIV
jgi:hypothetical protein